MSTPAAAVNHGPVNHGPYWAAQTAYWAALDQLVQTCEVVIDRPRASAHPRYADLIYPLDYGYLAGTTTTDGGGIDVWFGSLPTRNLTGLILTVDLHKRDAEIKLLLACTPAEAQLALDFHTTNAQAPRLLLREMS